MRVLPDGPARVRFVLASASPARRETLRRAGVTTEVIVSGVDESAVTAPSPGELALTLSTLKAVAVADTLSGAGLVLGCDSLLDFEGEALGKPGSAAVAVQRWQRLRGASGVLHTGHTLVDLHTGQRLTRLVSTTVHFAEVTDAEILAYCASGEPEQVAGAFTIDGLGSWFVEGIEGDPHNVVGVSLPTLRTMLHELGRGLDQLGYPAQ